MTNVSQKIVLCNTKYQTKDSTVVWIVLYEITNLSMNGGLKMMNSTQKKSKKILTDMS